MSNMAVFKTLLFLQFFSIGVGITQSSFNLARSLPYPQADFRHVILDNDTIAGIGIGFNSSIEWKQGVVVAQLDSSGNVLNANIIVDSLGDAMAVGKAWGGIIKTADSGYAATAAAVERTSAFLIKLNSDLQVEFIKEYPDSVNLSNYFYKLTETPEGYLLYGAIQRPDYEEDGFIRYVDRQGNTIWFKYVDHSDYSNGVVSLAKINDSLYVYGMVNGVTPKSSNSSLHLINLGGNIISSLVFSPEPEIGYIRSVWPAFDGGIIIYGLYVTEIVHNTKLVQPTLSKLNSNFQTEWISHFGNIRTINSSITLWDFAPTPDGNFIGAGETTVNDGDDPTRRVGWLYKFSPEGDSIWERKVDAPFLPLYYTNSGFFSGVGVLSSGSIVAGGTAKEGNTEYCWLVKVTAGGCLDTLWCQTVAAPEVPGNVPQPLRIYPNPANQTLNMEYPGLVGQGTLRLCSLQGQTVSDIRLPGRSSRVSVPVSHLAPGIYFAELHSGQNLPVRGKVVIAR